MIIKDPLRDKQQDPPVAECYRCGEPLWHEVYVSPYISGEFCEDCATEIAWTESGFDIREV